MEFVQYFGAVFEFKAILLLLGGTIGGLILGATPGLSPTMAVALLIPFTFRLTPAEGLILLGATYTSTVAGGAVSAILLKVPGAPANIATALDGHEMAKKGQGATALHLAFLSSGIGGLIGVFLLIFLTPVLANWALQFLSTHIFWMGILGITVIGTLDTNSAVKGLISGGLGLWLAMIGIDSSYGAERFVFTSNLTGGVDIIAALIGLFAIPQVIGMFAKGRKPAQAPATNVVRQSIRALILKFLRFILASIRKFFPSILASIRLLLQCRAAIGIGAAVGSVIGIVPGVGGQIAGLLAYDQARKFSSDPSKFGKGNPAGVVAAETANSAMVGTSLIPLLTLSVPGSPTAAVLLGGLLIHGIFPGPDLFARHPDVIWTFIDSMMIGQVLMVIFGILIAGLAARVSKIPISIVGAAIIVLALFGSYAVRQSIDDVLVMMTLGTAMYFLEKFGFSAAPMALGLILGKLIEDNFIQAYTISKTKDGPWVEFFTGPLNIALISIVVLSIGYSLWAHFGARKPAAPESGGA